MNRGIIMEIDNSEIVLMTAEGRFTKIPLAQRSCQIGEEIYFTEVRPYRRKPWIIASSFVAVAAAMLLLLFNLSPGSVVVANKDIVAYVSIDINPSVEMGIDENNIVLEIRGVNADGVELIKNIAYAGKDVATLTEDLLQEAEKKYLSKGEGDIIISSTMQENGNDKSQVNDVAVINKLKTVVVQHIEKSHPEQAANYQVTAFAADKEVRKAAESKGLSAGKYTIYLNAKDKGQSTSIEDLKKESVHAIAKKSGGLDKLVTPENLSKEKTKQLLKDDESGDLDRKLKKSSQTQKEENKKTEDAKKQADKQDSKNNGKKQSKKDDSSPTVSPAIIRATEPSPMNNSGKNSLNKDSPWSKVSERWSYKQATDNKTDNKTIKETPTPSVKPTEMPTTEPTKKPSKKEREKKTIKATPEPTPIIELKADLVEKLKAELEKEKLKEEEEQKEKEKEKNSKNRSGKEQKNQDNNN
jgi:hypothetical protein